MSDKIYEVILNSNTFPFLRDHRVGGDIIFPAAGYIELVLSNLFSTRGAVSFPLVLEKVKILAPLRLPNDAEQCVHVIFRSGQGDEKFSIQSMSAKKQQIIHLEGVVRESGSFPGPPVLHPRTIMEGLERTYHGAEYYKMYEKNGIGYGSYFQSVRQLDVNAAEALSRLVLNSTAVKDETRFILHPARLDGALQTAGVFLLTNPADMLYLPLAIGRLVLYSHVEGDCFCYVKSRQPERHSEKSRHYDIFLCDDTGKVFVEINDFIIKSVPGMKKSGVRQVPGKSITTTTTTNADAETGPGVAIIGMAGIFPGADNPGEFWDNLLAARCSIKEIPAERWDIEDYYDHDREAPGKTHCRCGSFLDNIDQFDPMFFGISVKKAALIDPQQRLLLQTAWHALEDAGYANGRLENTNTPVYIGVSNNDYINRGKADFAKVSAHAAAGNSFSSIPNRISHFLNLQGASLAIDTACSSSLVALYYAWKNILEDGADYALAGGVNLTLNPNTHVIFSKAGVLSPRGTCTPFDDRADGYVRGEGVGVLLLKRLTLAARERDHIYAVIKGAAVNHSGRTNGFNRPNSQSESAVILEAAKQAGFSLNSVRYMEAHGTGTPLGDSIEFRGLKSAFNAHSAGKGYCALGSLKSNMGHMESAAGMAGLIKCALALKHRRLPPHINFCEPNKRFDLTESPFYINDRAMPWPEDTLPPRAGVSAFGFGGTNAHVLLEEAPSPRGRNSQSLIPPLFVVSARQAATLELFVQEMKEYLHKQDDFNLNDCCYSLAAGRRHFPCRLAVVARDKEDLLNKLEGLSFKKNYTGEDFFLTVAPRGQSSKAALLIPHNPPSAWAELFANVPFLKQFGPVDCSDTAPGALVMHLLGLQLAMVDLLSAYGLRPDVFCGTGRGFYLAALLAGGTTMDEVAAALTAGRLPGWKGPTEKKILTNRAGGFFLGRVGEQGSLITQEIQDPDLAEKYLIEQGYDPVIRLDSITTPASLAALAGRSYARGLDVDWEGYYHSLGDAFYKLSLPGYPFKQNSYWLD